MENIKKIANDLKIKNIPFKLDTQEFYNFVKRLTNETYANKIKVKKIKSADNFDAFKIYDEDDFIIIEATSGVAATNAFNLYLKEICHYYIGFLNTNGSLPLNPLKVNKVIEKKSAFTYRYFLNYCTFGYSFSYYKWKDYEALLDRILLSGYNLVLDPIGQESIWYYTLIKLGYSKEDAKKFLVDITFMPWFNMMNITNYLPYYDEKEFKYRLSLANKFARRLEAFGASIMLPGYCGMVPNDIKKHYGVSIFEQGLWCGYDRPSYLDYKDPHFKKVALTFYETQNELLAKNKVHYYSSDPFHEGGIIANFNLKEYANVVYDIMSNFDNKAIWVLQGWDGNPKLDILNGIPKERTLITNLLSDYKIEGDFNNAPWIYCSVNNFGGNHVLRGSLKKAANKPFELIQNDNHSLVGIGLMPEAIECDELIFDMQAECAINNQEIDLYEFIYKHLICRYSCVSDSLIKAYDLLINEIYTDDMYPKETESLYVRAPKAKEDVMSFVSKRPFGIYPKEVIKIAYELLKNYESCQNSLAYKFDLIDIVRQANADFGWHLKYLMEIDYQNKDLDSYLKHSELFLKMIDLQDELVANHPRFLLSNTLAYPLKYGRTKEAKAHFLHCQKRILTIWGDERCKCILNDYTNREYSGLLKHYYKNRWEMFINNQIKELKENITLPEIDWYKIGDEFASSKDIIKCKLNNNLKEKAYEILRIIENNKY